MLHRFPLFAITLSLLTASAGSAQTTVTFEQLSLAPQSYQEFASYYPQASFTTQGVTFDTSAGFGTWSYSNVYNPNPDPSRPAYENAYSAYSVGTVAVPAGPGTNGAGGSPNFAIANNYKRGEATISWAAGQRITSLEITNTTYAYRSMKFGDDIAGERFGGSDGSQEDFFLVKIYGKNGDSVLSQRDVYLADFHHYDVNAAYITDQWKIEDLSDFDVNVTSLEFDLSSKRNNEAGNLSPAYFAIDNLVLTPVPEPGSILALATGAGLLWRRRRLLVK